MTLPYLVNLGQFHGQNHGGQFGRGQLFRQKGLLEVPGFLG